MLTQALGACENVTFIEFYVLVLKGVIPVVYLVLS